MTQMIGIMALSSSSQQGDRRSWGGYQLQYDALGNQEVVMKITVETTLAQDG
jgi:hypothetical protein